MAMEAQRRDIFIILCYSFLSTPKTITRSDLIISGYLSPTSSIDRDFEIGINYYMLRQTDYDGKFEDSEIISIDNRLDSAPTLIKITNSLGQDVKPGEGGILFYHYSDGTIIKKMQ